MKGPSSLEIPDRGRRYPGGVPGPSRSGRRVWGIECSVSVSPLLTGGDSAGVIILMDALPG